MYRPKRKLVNPVSEYGMRQVLMFLIGVVIGILICQGVIRVVEQCAK